MTQYRPKIGQYTTIHKFGGKQTPHLGGIHPLSECTTANITPTRDEDLSASTLCKTQMAAVARDDAAPALPWSVCSSRCSARR